MMLKANMLACLLSCIILCGFSVKAQNTCSSPLLDTQVQDIRGNDINLCDYYGKVLLIVNISSTGSKTELSEQYNSLEALYQKYKDNGLVVLAFPSSDFQPNNPSSESEIEQFARTKFKVTFPMFEKVAVGGPAQAPFYKKLTTEQTNLSSYQKEPVQDDFQKYLIDRKGHLVDIFAPSVSPLSKVVTESIEKQLSFVSVSN